MNYDQTIDFLFSLQKFGIKFGLSSTRNLLRKLGNPHDNLPCIHLAGTNGKGSVGAFLCSVLMEAGYKVGFYISPHLVSFRERFLINGRMISETDVIDLTRRVKKIMVPKEPPTFFEFVTTMAFLYFAEQKVDLVVLETGMGGRLDATNVARPLVGVITNISLEHTDYLGRTLEEIAREKAGIIKPGLPLVSGEKRNSIRSLFEVEAREKGGRFYFLGRDFKTRVRPDGGFDYYGLRRNFKGLSIGLLGSHQIENAALALAALELAPADRFLVKDPDIRTGLAWARWPGRAEKMKIWPDGPELMLDGAHNPAAARALARLLKAIKYERLHLILGVMSDKDIRGILSPLLPLASHLYLTRPRYSRAADPETLLAAADLFTGPKKAIPSLPQALSSAREQAGPGDLILVTGSLFTVGEMKGHLS